MTIDLWTQFFLSFLKIYTLRRILQLGVIGSLEDLQNATLEDVKVL
jgi:hypothetical protein